MFLILQLVQEEKTKGDIPQNKFVISLLKHTFLPYLYEKVWDAT